MIEITRHPTRSRPRADLPRAGAAEGESFPLSYGQRSLWFLERMAPGAPLWTLAGAARAYGGVDPAALRWALEKVVERHPALRTTFHVMDGEPVQRVHPDLPPEIVEIDAAGDSEAELVARIEAEVFRPFDLETGPLVRMGIFRLGPGSEAPYALCLAVHHLVSDLWSIGILLRELEAFHREATGGEAAQEAGRLAPLPVTYADYVAWQRDRLAGPEGERLWEFWRGRLAGELPVLEVPTDRPRPPVQTWNGASRSLTVDADLAARFRRLARSHGATLYVALLAAFETLLHRFSSQEDLLVGTPAAGRTAPELAGLVGYFVSPVVIRGDLSGEPSFAELLARGRGAARDAFEHQDFPFSLLTERLQARRDPGRSPVFQAFFVLQKAPRAGGFSAFALGQGGLRAQVGGLDLESLPLASRSAQLDLLLLAAESEGGLILALEHNSDLFDAATADRMLGHLRGILAGAVERPDLPVGDLPWLREPERAQLLGEAEDAGSGLAAEFAGACLHELFERRADQSPAATAVVYELEGLGYGDLDRRANRLARHLIRHGVGPEVRVCLCVERSLDMVVALLAVLKAGGAYVPLDPAWPAERLGRLLADAGHGSAAALEATAPLLVGRGRELSGLPELTDRWRVLDLDAAREAIAAESAERPAVAVHEDNLAYVIYTSGSTGAPKGVTVTHGNVVRLLAATAPAFGFGADDVWTLFHSYAFDFSVWEIWGALAFGGRLVVVPREVSRSPEAVCELLATERVTVLNQVPSVFRQVIHADAADPQPLALRLVLFGGEALEPGMLRPWFDRHGDASPRLFNLYGITETTVHTTWRPVTRADVDGPSPIGRSIPGVLTVLLDRRMQPVPVGVPGEIHVGGAGVARGYLHRPDLTAERFVPDPFGEPGGRLYRSGDLARYRLERGSTPAGELDIEYLGRIDHQVKLRGFRIELGEIESRLAEHPGVREAVVVAQGSAGERRLVAFFVPSENPSTPAELRAHLARALPEPMVPAAFVALAELPRTPSGKIDRRALPAGPLAPESVGGAEAPRTPEEEIVAGLWAELLGVERVGSREDVFEIGAHSLLVTRMSWRLREAFGVELPLAVLFAEPTPAGLARRIAAARAATEEAPPRPVLRDGELPLSLAQERLWFEDQMAPGSTLYNMPAMIRLGGWLDAATLERAFAEVVRRHEALRTTFPATRGRPRQEIAAVIAAGPFRLPRIDLAGLPPERRDEEALRQALAEARRPFELVAGPLLRGFLLRLGDEDHALVLDMHHIVSDGWSVGILVEELGALYGAFSAGLPSPLPELPIQYADFAVWQREQLAGEALEARLDWWRRRLDGAPPALDLPADRPRPPVRGARGSEVPVRLSAELEEALARLGRREGATLFMTVFAAFQALVFRVTGQEDLVLSTPVAGRQAETERLIGFFVNNLVVRTDLGGSPSFRELVGRVRTASLEAYAHQDLPFARLVEELVPQRDPARSPLFQVVFALQDRAPDAAELPGLETAPVHLPAETAKTDLSLTLHREGGGVGGIGGIAGWIEYSTDLFDRTTMQRFARRFERLVSAAVADPERAIDSLPLLGEEERHQVALEWGSGAWAAEPRKRCVHELFEEQAARTPERPAVVAGDLRLTYAELNDRADRLARHLAALGVGPEVPVAVLLERSAELVVALLAIFKAGGAYVPLDPGYPVERLEFSLRDSGARALIAEELPAGLSVGERVALIKDSKDCKDSKDSKDNKDSKDAGLSSLESLLSLQSLAFPGALAYVLYTSGSTGAPKGVPITHENLLPLLLWSREAFGLGEHTRVLQSLAPTFDFGLFEILTTISFGGTLWVREGADLGDVEAHLAEIRRQGINTLHATPSFFRALAAAAGGEGLPSLQVVHLGGEALTEQLAAEVFATAGPGCRLLNGYGPTEAAVNCALFEVAREPRGLGSVPIGRPSAASCLYVLDQLLQPAPAGVPGELLVGGVGLSRGYLGQPELTAERFVPDPFGEPGGRLYHTGDRARWLADGATEFLGRLDQQVKLRGFRIEPGEIEAAAVACPGIEQAAVLPRQDRSGLRLVAFLVPADGAPRDTAAVRAFLRGRLPEPMVPAAFVWLDALPLTASGKVDRRALAGIEIAGEARERGDSAPRTPIEEGLAGIWREVLGITNVAGIGPQDDFFELGGHSLLATQVVSRVRESFSVELPVRELFAAPRLADLAGRIEEERRRGAGLAAPPITPVSRDEFPAGLPLSFSQEWMWIAGQLADSAAAYNASLAVRLSGPLDPGALAAALREVARRHSVLRTRFVASESGPLQIPDPALGLPVLMADLGALPAAVQEREALDLVRAEAARPFDLAAGPPARALLVRLDADDHLLVLGLHHLVTDGWSAGVMLREVAAHYGNQNGGASLPALPVQYGDYAVWQRRWLAGEPLETLLGWWREHLAGPPPVLELPADRPGAAAPGGLGERLPFLPAPGQIEALRALARSRGSTLFAVLLAAFNTLLARFCRQDDLVVGTPVANRTRRELEGLIGYFVNDLPLRTRLAGDPSFLDLLDRVHETALGAWAHQDLPLPKIVQEIGGGAPLFRAWFQLQNAPWPSLELPGVALAPLESEAPVATFDLELLTVELDGGLSGHLVYNRELFRRDTAESLLRGFHALLGGIAADPGRRLSGLPLLAPGERHAVLYVPGAPEIRGATPLHRAFEAMAAAQPDAPALTFEGETLSYGELNRKADIVARRLRAQGVGPESRVGLRAERSLELVVGILGILKAGGAYVPLDPDYPQERLDWLQEDAKVQVLVTREENVLSLTKLVTAKRVEREAGPDDLAYVIYTSGSTGRPKGVMVTHRQAARLFEATRGFGFGPEDVWTLFHSYAFDFSVWEIWGALLHGSRLVVVPHRVSRSPEAFLDLLAAERVTVLNQTPSAFYQLLHAEEARPEDAPPLALRLVIFGGEALEPSRLLPWFERHGDARPALVNMYGITETTVHVTLRPLSRADAESPDSVIGRPLDDLRLVLLDGALQPLPPGAVGEIFVGGGGVARGYLGRPELTAERFVPDPFAAEAGDPGARLYRSGDLARLRLDGERADLVYLGRADRQLKVRGYRIEPGEVEAALVRHPGVAQAAVFARKLSAEDVRLVAGFVPRSSPAPTPAALREHLLGLLPEAWVPGLFVPVPELPLTAHGKVDRDALAALADRAGAEPAVDAARPDNAVAPLSPLEEHLAALWGGLLKIDHVGRDDNFFTLGGHSLLVTWIAARVREAFGIPPPMRSFFERPTVGNLAVGVLSELAARLEPGRFEEIFACVEGLPDAEVERLAASKEGVVDLVAPSALATPSPTLPRADARERAPSAHPGSISEMSDRAPAGVRAPSPAQRGRVGEGAPSALPSLSRVRDLLARVPPPSPQPEPRLRVTTLAFPTCNRPAVLERGLESQALAAREHGRTDLRFAVLDDSPDPAVREEYRGRLAALRRRLGVEISYAGQEEKRRFAAALQAEGVPPAAVAATLFDPEGIGLPIGANRNAVLLQGIGEGVVSVDDDTLALGGPPPEPEPGVEILTGTVPEWAFLSAREPGSIRGFATRAEAMAAVDLRTVDLPAIHESLLGREVADWLRDFDPDAPAALDRADAAVLKSLESGGRVVVTTNGWVGDCGWRNPFFYMLQTGESWRHLVRSADFYRTVTASKEIVRFLPRPAVGNAESFMATMFWGFDHRGLLPPFPPVLWGEDLLYGLTLQLAFPAARAGHLPWVALHDPIEQRGFWPGEMVRTASGINHSRLLSAMLVDYVPDPSLAPADGLRRLGAFLQELGRMEPREFDALALRRIRDRADAFAAGLEARLAEWRDWPEPERPEAGELWAADVRRYLDILREHAADPGFAVPLDLLYHREPEEARRLTQKLLVHHGTVLIHWPELCAAVRSLKARGWSLAEALP